MPSTSYAPDMHCQSQWKRNQLENLAGKEKTEKTEKKEKKEKKENKTEAHRFVLFALGIRLRLDVETVELLLLAGRKRANRIALQVGPPSAKTSTTTSEEGGEQSIGWNAAGPAIPLGCASHLRLHEQLRLMRRGASSRGADGRGLFMISSPRNQTRCAILRPLRPLPLRC
eukprot:scaffold2808_cov255-Pinguiococcus_pyrenoidosus.AAC.51